MPNQSIIQSIRELNNQIAYSKNIGVFFGAGTSCALKVPNIVSLTEQTAAGLAPNLKAVWDKITANCPASTEPTTVEGILNKARQIRDITDEDAKKEYLGICGSLAMEFDKAVCKLIYKIISKSEDGADRTKMRNFVAWLVILPRFR